MRRLCGSNSGRSVGGCGYMRTPHPALPFSNLPLPFFCIILTPPHSLSTVFSPKTGALSHRAVRGINIPDSNCIGEDRSTALRLSCPNDMPWSRPNGSSRAGQCFFLRPLLLVRRRGTLLDLGLGTLKKGLVVLANQRFALCFRSSTLACSQTRQRDSQKGGQGRKDRGGVHERFGKEYGCVWMYEKKNRESPPIFANRIFLAPSCSAPAYRLRRNRTPSGKMLGKNRRAGFSFWLSFILF